MEVKRTNNFEEAIKIAESLHGDYFNDEGLEKIKKAVKEQILYGVFEDEKMVGFIIFKEINPEVIEITWMGVLPEYQEMGYGSEMLKESMSALDEKYKICEVKTLADTNPDPGYARTRKFYKKHGFIGLDVISSYPDWGDENPCQIFVKFLK